MGNRFYITGVQLGILIAYAKEKVSRKFFIELLEKIENKQYICEINELNRLKYKEAKEILNKLKRIN